MRVEALVSRPFEVASKKTALRLLWGLGLFWTSFAVFAVLAGLGGTADSGGGAESGSPWLLAAFLPVVVGAVLSELAIRDLDHEWHDEGAERRSWPRVSTYVRAVMPKTLRSAAETAPLPPAIAVTLLYTALVAALAAMLTW